VKDDAGESKVRNMLSYNKEAKMGGWCGLGGEFVTLHSKLVKKRQARGSRTSNFSHFLLDASQVGFF
jgi:hypothetical protein